MAVAIVLAAACAARESVVVPPAIAPSTWQVPALTTRTLASGLGVVHVENHRLPYVAVSAVVTGAGARADGDHAGLAAFAAQLAVTAAGERDRAQLGRALASAGATIDVAISADSATFTLAGPSEHLGWALDVLADVVRRPRVDPSELARVRAATTTELGDSAIRQRAIAARLFERIVFGEHPYAHAAEGTAAGIGAVTAHDVAAFWAEHYRVSALTIVVVGDVSDSAFDDLLARRFDAAPEPARPAAVAASITRAPPELAYVDVPGSSRAIVMIGRAIPGSTDPQADATELASQVLAGGQTSRLAQRLGAATTGMSAGAWRGAWAGTWAIAASVDTAATGRAIGEALAAIAELAHARELPELDRARQAIVVELAATFDTDEAAARAIARRIGRGESIEQLRGKFARLARLDAANVSAAAASWTDLTIVIVGDWSVIAPTLPALGLPIQRYEAP